MRPPPLGHHSHVSDEARPEPRPGQVRKRTRRREQTVIPGAGLSDFVVFAGALLLEPLASLLGVPVAGIAMAVALIVLRAILNRRISEQRRDKHLAKRPLWLNRTTDALFISSVLIIAAQAIGFHLSILDQGLTLVLLWLSLVMTVWESLKAAVPFGQVVVGFILPLIGGIGLLGANIRISQHQDGLAYALFAIACAALAVGFAIIYRRQSALKFLAAVLGMTLLAALPTVFETRVSTQDFSLVLLGFAVLAVAVELDAPTTNGCRLAGGLTSIALAIQCVGSVIDTWWISAVSCAFATVAACLLTVAASTGRQSEQRIGLTLGAVAVLASAVSLIQTGQVMFGIISIGAALSMAVAAGSNGAKVMRWLGRKIALLPDPQAVKSLRSTGRRLVKLLNKSSHLDSRAVLHLAVFIVAAYVATTWLIYK